MDDGAKARANLDRALKAMFRTLEARPAPDRLRSVAEQLDEGETPARAPRRTPRRRTP